MTRHIDPYTEEYREYEEAFNHYWDTKKKIEKYADEYRITSDDSILTILRPLKCKLPHLAGDKRRAWGKVLRLTREAQNDE
ncbi:hypothetical protein [Bacillus pretiosus]|uniref:Uncharacterized protein n=1 Tax=Bacillus pretiosus TaxID=2983392 RepID=A0ABT3EYV8_9BACI|nr:hypothetical protein [Bacillus pretiosus]MCW1241952.1 hypothetical protein [Bacillus pretiosus]